MAANTVDVSDAPTGDINGSLNPQDLTVEQITSVYRKASSFNTFSSECAFHPNLGDPSGKTFKVTALWTRRAIDMKTPVPYSDSVLMKCLDDASETGYQHLSGGGEGSSWPQRASPGRLWQVVSPSGKRRVEFFVVKEGKALGKKEDKKQFVEIWNGLEDSDILAVDDDVHGDVVGNDGQFGCMEWSPCEKFLLYVAEKKKPKAKGFFERKLKAKKSKDKDDGDGDKGEPTIPGEEYVYRESWGEQLMERHQTVICVLDIVGKTISVLSHVPDDVSPGQASWGPDNTVVFIGWCQEPYRLGLRFCTQRKSFLYKTSLQEGSECEKLSEEGFCARCPSFSPDKSRLIYLDLPEGGPHNSCSRLVMIDWKKLQAGQLSREVVVDIVRSPYKAGYNYLKEEFTGLYNWAQTSSVNRWLSDGVHVLITSYFRSGSKIVLVNTNTKAVRYLNIGEEYPFKDQAGSVTPRGKINFPDGKASEPAEASSAVNSLSCALLDVRKDDILMVCSSPDRVPFLTLGSLSVDGKKRSSWKKLRWSCDRDLCFDWQLFVLDPRHGGAPHPDYEHVDFEAVLYLPKSKGQDRKPPLVLFPHGGPHSTFDCSYIQDPVVFALCGFAVLLVNYRGSLGFGQDNIESLLGHIGDYDVKDCMLALDTVKGLIDADNVFVYGGSHGGFLAAHLVGQYPEVFRATSMRNPVINLPSRIYTSDNPDTPWAEAGLKFEHGAIPDANVLRSLYEASPIRYVDKVKTPVLLHIGQKDLRVPPSQGMEYFKVLKSRGVPVKLMSYPESNHSLSDVDVESENLVNTILWFVQHLTYNAVPKSDA